MDRRTQESPMEWEYHTRGPLDPTSPFAQAAQGGRLQNGFSGFGSSAVNQSRPNPFATPSKAQTTARSFLTPQHASSRPPAPAFRNPAFATPRKPADEITFSEASGAEDSPSQIESDYPNDTPEIDRQGDVTMGGTITPSKIDKSLRYRKHASGKGEIRSARGIGANDITRRRKKQNNPLVRYQQESDDEDTDGGYARHERRPRSKGSGGVVGSMFRMMDEHRDAPDNLGRWVKFAVNVFLMFLFCGTIAALVQGVMSDVRTVHEGARNEIRGKAAACQDEYMANGCDTTDAPAFKKMCSEWLECMRQSQDIVRTRATLNEVANIMNDFFGRLNLKAWGAFIGFILLLAIANNTFVGRNPSPPSQHHAPAPPRTSHSASMQPQSSGDVMWIPVQTPRRHRQAVTYDDTDTDGSPSVSQQYLPSIKASGRRSPTKRERSMSPIKYRSPRKEY